MKKLITIVAALAIAFCSVSAQEALGRRINTTSPEINPDGTVTFRLLAPKAITVAVSGDCLPDGDGQMTENKDGVWEFTTPVLAPELYKYHFVVNGTDMLDPSNIFVCRDVKIGRAHV